MMNRLSTNQLTAVARAGLATGLLMLAGACAVAACNDDDHAGGSENIDTAGAGGARPNDQGSAGRGTVGAGGGIAGVGGGPLACGITPGKADPIPASVFGETIGPEGYVAREIKPDLYLVTDGTYQSLFLVSTAGVILVDAPPSLGEKLLTAVRAVTDQPITHVIYSHAHADHIGGASLVPAGAKFIAHRSVKEHLERSSDPKRPVPTDVFDTTFALTVGGQTLELSVPFSTHAPGNAFVYAPAQKVLMLVDVIYPGWVPFRGLGSTVDVPGFIAAHDEALSYDFDLFVGGHLTKLGTRADVESQKEYVADLRTNAQNALQSVDAAMVTMGADPKNSWENFQLYLTAVDEKCAADTLKKWRGRLAGADVFTASHCDAMQSSLRVD